ncbi:LOW QUALITY PROTEIN: regulator of G-protein signaling loco-like [Pecten maximus]|uniref:LOW QUALITY PROTEIN: regulator of G-protein signaling loco-like n=1 Tax=Pecten maximus TaxID=6579 RepID=UPI0014583589|nr:LOW QUALITY PROTEIN: regulator of G-protein signaling loco-like [Pecten maximus]
MMPYNPGSAAAPGSSSHTKRRKKRPIHGTKTVSVTRGRSGYGFTISGQHPCVLSCIVGGSKAEEAGLKAGDYLVSVNSENVTKAPHDDVVRMVGMSTGTLILQVAENYNSSDSSDDEYHHRTKARYPNRVRTRAPGGGSSRHGDKVLGECNQRDKHSSGHDHRHNKDNHLHRYDHSDFKFTSAIKPRLHTPVGAENTYAALTNHSTPQLAGAMSVDRHSTVASVHATPAFNFQAKQAIVKSTTQSAREPRQRPVGSRHNNHSRHTKDHTHFNTSLAGASISAIMKTSVTNTTANNAFIAMEDEDEDGDDEESLLSAGTEEMRVVVGYIGSIEMPSDANKPHIKIQSIRNAVRRLRVEQKIHTLVLMEVTEDGVKLTNSMGTTVAHYPADRLTFSGISPDDKRFFGIVTLHSTNSDDASSDNGSQEESTPSGSCHVFMVDPEMRSHNMHAAKAKSFGITCTSGRERQSCNEFPKSATPVIMAITNLYKNRPGVVLDNEVALSQAFADPSRAVQRSHSNSSNSDSGLGFGRDDTPNNNNVYVVDMPPPAGPPPTPQPTVHNGMHAHKHHCSPDNLTIPTPIRDTRNMFTHPDIRARLNVSVCSTDDLQLMKTNSSDKLNIRAMPDPTLTPGTRTLSSDGLEMQNSAASLRASTHKIFKAQRPHIPSQGVGSDQESSASQGSEIYRSASNPDLYRPSGQLRPTSAPSKQFWDDSFNGESQNKAETVDLDGKKLSPRAFLPPPFHQLRSPSAPPTFNHSFDMEDGLANTSGMGSLIEQIEQNHALRISSPVEDARKYDVKAKRKAREKERTTVDDGGERWAKPHNIRHRKMSRLQQPLSHSHESLVTIEQDVTTRQLSTASSANNINDHLEEDEKEEEEIGRIAGWAVGFEKMLNDVGGLAVFTEFLKKEFSEENIIFWRICEQYKSVSDNDKRKVKAKEIFTKHISVKASDPVNIDHVARQQVEKQLDHPSSSTFDKPQQEIFKLMKQDSYPRFLKSELYKTYLMREMGGEPLGLPKDDFQGILGAKELKEEKKKAAKSKDNEDKEKRRRSLLPWRQKSSKNNLKATSDSDLKKNSSKTTHSTSSTKESEVNNNTTGTQKKAAPGPGIDLSTIRKEVQASTKESKEDKETEENFKFCRVILPDGSTTVVCAKPGQRIRSVLGKLCDKRSLSIAAVDVFLLGSDKPLDLSEDISTLGSREVMIERRVLFRMDLPNRKSIGVKAKPNRSIRDVFKPILNKYGFKLDGICVELSGQPGMVDIDAQVSTIDNQRVLIKHHEECIAISRNEGFRSKRTQLVVKYPPDFHVNSSQESTSLDVITNQIFEDLMRGKSEVAHNFDELGILDPEKSPQVQRKGSGDHRSLGLFGLLRKESQGGKVAEMPKVKGKHKVTFNLQKNQTRKAAARDDDQFLDLLSKVQSGRLDDQRGLETQNSEIPEFLQNKSHHPSGRESAPPVLSGGRARADDYIKNNHEKYVSYTRGQMTARPSSVSLDSMTFDRRNSKTDKDKFESGDFDSCNIDSPGNAVQHGNQSFSSDGVIPSNAEAQEFFQAPVPDCADFDDPCMAEKSLRDIGFDYSFNMYQAKAWGYSRHNPYAQQKLSSLGNETPTNEDSAFLDETLTPNDPDFDNTLISSPVQGHIRSLSVPVSLHSPASKGGKSRENGLVQTSTPLTSKSDIVQKITPLSQKSEIRNGIGDLMSGKTYSSGVGHSSAFHQPTTQITSPQSDNKPVVIDLGDSETNITFV